MKIIPQAFAHNFGPTGTTIYCTYQGQLYRAIARNEITTQQVSVMVDDDGKAYCLGHSPPQRIEAYNRVDRFYHAQPQEVEAGSAGYWFIYKIEYFDSSANLTRTEFWLGGNRNRLLAEYTAYGFEEPVPFPTYSDSSGSASVSITGGLGTATATMTASANNNSSNISRFDIPQLKALAQILSPAYRLNYAFTATTGSGSAIGLPLDGNNGAATSVGLREGIEVTSPRNVLSQTGRARVTDGYKKLQRLIDDPDEIEVADWTTDSFFLPQVTELGILLTSVAAMVSGSASATQTTTMQAYAAKYTAADVVTFTRSGDTVYCAIRYRPEDPQLSPTNDNLQISYFTVQRGVNEQVFHTDAEIETGVAASDWRSFMLYLDEVNDGDINTIPNPGSDNSCFEAYKATRGANIENGVIRQVENLTAMRDELIASNAEISYTEFTVTAGSSCTTGTVSTGTRRAVKLSEPIPVVDETTTTTTILWAAP